MEPFHCSGWFYACISIYTAAIISVNGQDPKDCPPITVETLGSPSMLTSDGLISSVFAAIGDNQLDLPDVQITRINIVCEVAGSVFNTSRGVSVLVEYDCNSNRGDLPECTNGVDSITRQFQFGCTDNQWVASVAGSDILVASSSTTATFATLLDNRCGLCIDPLQSAPTADNVTHCDACHPNCNRGQMRCFGTGANECCNFYLNGTCVAECPSGLTENDDFICGCLSSSNPANGFVNSTDVVMFGDTVAYTCSENFNLIGVETRTCTPSGWDGDEPTCQAVTCPSNLPNPVGGSVGYSEPPLFVGSTADYICMEGQNLVGNRVRTCVNNNGVGEWSGSDPICVLRATDPSNSATNSTHGTCSCNSQVTTVAVSSAVMCSVVFYIVGVLSTILIYIAITRCKETCKQVTITSSEERSETTAPVYEYIKPIPGIQQAGFELQENVAYGPIKK